MRPPKLDGEPLHLVLDEQRRARPATLAEWADFFGSDRRVVAHTLVGRFRLSTVFVGAGGPAGMRRLFETVRHVARGDGSSECVCVAETWGGAEDCHRALVVELAALEKAEPRDLPLRLNWGKKP
jgi:hypothetical protein